MIVQLIKYDSAINMIVQLIEYELSLHLIYRIYTHIIFKMKKEIKGGPTNPVLQCKQH
jgi:hypothetical protein